MAKIRQLPNKILNQELEFLTPHGQAELYWNNFLNTELGSLYQIIPWKELCKQFYSTRYPKCGKKPEFELQGKLALQFLKSHGGLSDKDLMARMATDYSYQFFCGVYYKPGDKVPGFKIISDIRCELSKCLKIGDFQKTLAQSWKPYLNDTHVLLTDATCYESFIRYPTDVKLLWECCAWTYGQMKRLNKALQGRMPRSKFMEIEQRFLNYQRNKKKSWKKAQKLIGSLLYLLHKLNAHLNEIETRAEIKFVLLPKAYKERRTAIKKVYLQQTKLHATGERSPGMIVSIDKSYLRPIVRGKEVKRVEFGAKVNMIQVDGINFIEHLNYNAFNEGTRLISSIRLHRDLFGRCTHVAGDRIYATNRNRSYCHKHKIVTSFIPKGNIALQFQGETKKIKSLLSKERATRMEGSFGTEKNHYSLDRIKARTKSTESMWIFFGVHTANAVRLASRIELDKKILRQAA